MSSIIFGDDRRFDEYTSRLRFNAGAGGGGGGYAAQPRYHASDPCSGADYRTHSDAASCDSSPSPGYLACSCRAAAESPKTPADGPPSRYFEHQHHHQQQHQQPAASFAIHQLLGLGAVDVDYERQLALQSVDVRQPPPPPCHCVQSFSSSLTPSACLVGARRPRLPYHDRATYCHQRHDSTDDATWWPHLPQPPPLQIPPPSAAPAAAAAALRSWSSGEPQPPRKTVHHHHYQHRQPAAAAAAPQHPAAVDHGELQAYYCAAARLHQPASVDVTSYDSFIGQYRSVAYLPADFRTYILHACRPPLLGQLSLASLRGVAKSSILHLYLVGVTAGMSPLPDCT